jgi:hypothetical protein
LLSYDGPVQGSVPFTEGKEINAHGQVVGIDSGDDGIWHSMLSMEIASAALISPDRWGPEPSGLTQPVTLLVNISRQMDQHMDSWQNSSTRQNHSKAAIGAKRHSQKCCACSD